MGEAQANSAKITVLGAPRSSPLKDDIPPGVELRKHINKGMVSMAGESPSRQP